MILLAKHTCNDYGLNWDEKIARVPSTVLSNEVGDCTNVKVLA
jgi:hypothetical protein